MDQPTTSTWLLTEARTIRCLARRTVDAGLSARLEELADEFDQAAWVALPGGDVRPQRLC